MFSEILSYLDVRDLMDFAETIPKLSYLISHPGLWRNVELDRVFVISESLLKLLEKNALQVKNLAVNNPSFFHHNKLEFEAVMSTMINVTFLDMTMCNIVEEMNFLRFMPHLKHCVLDCLNVLTTNGFQQNLPQCKSIVTLSMKGNPFLSMFDVTEICSQLVNLEWLDTQGTCDFTPGNVDTILSACSKLRTFLFNSFYYSRLYHQWVELVNVKFQHVTFHYTTYQQVTRFEQKLRNEIHIEM